MPYIAQEDRPALNELIDELADRVTLTAHKYKYDGALAGILNYSMSRLVLNTLPDRRYWCIAMATGVLENVKQEFYRRFAAPYEDEQIIKNGDVY